MYNTSFSGLTSSGILRIQSSSIHFSLHVLVLSMIASSLARVSFVNFNTDLQRFRLCNTFYVQCTYYIFIIACNLFVRLFTLKRQLFHDVIFPPRRPTSSKSPKCRRHTFFVCFLPSLHLSFFSYYYTCARVCAFRNDDSLFHNWNRTQQCQWSLVDRSILITTLRNERWRIQREIKYVRN